MSDSNKAPLKRKSRQSLGQRTVKPAKVIRIDAEAIEARLAAEAAAASPSVLSHRARDVTSAEQAAALLPTTISDSVTGRVISLRDGKEGRVDRLVSWKHGLEDRAVASESGVEHDYISIPELKEDGDYDFTPSFQDDVTMEQSADSHSTMKRTRVSN